MLHACERLHARGAKITLDSVRADLDDRGSRTTLSKYVREWRETKLVERKMGAVGAAMPAIHRQIVALVEAETQRATEALRDDLSALEDAFEQQKLEAEQQRRRCKALEKENAWLRKQLDSQSESLRALPELIEALQKQVTA